MSAGQHIDYDGLVRSAILEAKRSVVRAVLVQVAKTGLLGGHHFLIAFNTQAPGVILSKRLREKYPVEMTIVLQHRFWDLEVNDDRFEVKLTFDSIPERLAIPYAAIKAFYDPSVPYMMPFEEIDQDGVRGRDGEETGPAGRPDRRRDRGQRRPRPSERQDAEPLTEPTARPPAPERAPVTGGEVRADPAPAPSPRPPAAAPPQPAQRLKPAVAEVKPPEKPAEAGGAKVLDLSSFRGKKK